MVKPRPARATVKCIDTYCELYKDLFVEVRAYECFKYLHIGLISELKRKSLPEIAKVVGIENEQGLLHFLTESPWKAEDLEKRRLEIILNILEGREIVVIIDETGDKKKGKKTDYVKRQYIGNLGKIENGLVSVNAYGYCEGMTFPLKFKVFKPKERLKEGDKYQTKPELGAELVMSAYLMICLHSDSLNPSVIRVDETFQTHELWNEAKGWKNWLNNLRLILQPFISFNFVLKWLKVFPIPQLSLGFPMLIAKLNEIDCLRYLVNLWDDFYYSSA